MVRHKSDVYEKDAFRRVELPPGLRFAVRQKLSEALWKTRQKTAFLARFAMRRDEHSTEHRLETGSKKYA